MSSDSGEEEEEEPYPPWLQIVLDEDSTYWDEVVVMREGIDGGKDKEWTEVKHIVVPDTTEAASGKGAGECRTFHIKRFVTILIASEPTSAPYIGLVDKVFRRRGAKKLREAHGKPVYRLGDFGVQAYWFYRPTEVPPTAWRKHTKLQQGSEGQAMYRLPGGKKLDMEDVSERQVLFSSHHTLHDYPEQQGILAMDGFLQACKVHWLGASAAELPRYEVHGSKLMAVQEPGFVVRGFLWCAAKEEPQLDARFKEVHRLETCKWPDKETCAIVQHCMKEYIPRRTSHPMRTPTTTPQQAHPAPTAAPHLPPSRRQAKQQPLQVAAVAAEQPLRRCPHHAWRGWTMLLLLLTWRMMTTWAWPPT